MSRSNVKRLLDGLASRGIVPVHVGEIAEIHRNHGQGMMNKAAGEMAPTWELWTYYFSAPLRMRLGDVELQVHGFPIIFCSHMPLKWLLRFPPERWEIAPHVDAPDQMRVDAPEMPKSWR